MNNYGGTPRDRFNARRFEAQARDVMSHKTDKAAVPYNTPYCRTESVSNVRGNENSNSERDEDLVRDYSLAMVYSPYQHWINIYDEETALTHGTIFEDLDKPFHGPACMGGVCNG